MARIPHALLAGGGTGGHVFPALAVGDELARRGWTVSFTGAATGLEARLVPARGIPFHPLPALPLVGKSAAARARALATLGRSALAARRLVRALGADAVLGTGGYVSAPAVVGARLAGRPVLLLEPNARAGVANRWLSRWAAGAAVAYDSARADLACPVWLTGVPVREEFFLVGPQLPPGAPRLLVLGGSQGARQINELLPAAVAAIAGRVPGLRVLHQVGERNLDAARAAWTASGVPASRVEVAPFLDDVAGAMAAAHLVVSRAGALATAEICAAGRASLLLPLAIAKGHQGENAAVLAAAGAAEVLAGGEATAERLGALLAELLSDRERLAQMARAARGLARPRAAAAIADRLEELVEEQEAGR
jgi:UDP-N-acetylglucosamine--N-acetylmuramyl-(pentapeptide) pyrophosphoryl-undecaprenol N-acetylglucosamine transferase